MKIDKVERIDKQTVKYSSQNGVDIIHKGGSVGWQLNNPLLVSNDAFTKRHGALGTDPQTEAAIFPNSKSAFIAFSNLLKSNEYKDLSLAEAMKKMSTAPRSGVRPSIDIENLPEVLKQLGDKVTSRKAGEMDVKEVAHVYGVLAKHRGYQKGEITNEFPLKWSSLGWDQREEFLPEDMWKNGGFKAKDGEKPKVFEMKNGQIVKMYDYTQIEKDPTSKQQQPLNAEQYASEEKYKIGNSQRTKEEIEKIDNRNKDPFGDKSVNDYSAGL